jgi:metal-dependent hydrolase (beta-lactamase superfamily II)
MEMNNMINGICNWMNGHTTLVGVATLVGGLHMVMTPNQPILGMLDIPAIKGVGVQTILGGFLTLAGACVLLG